MALSFTLKATDSDARAGELSTKHGTVRTPFFMVVGTYGAVKGLSTRELKQMQAPVLLANTYHLFVRPGEQYLRDYGGLHRFMNWDGVLLTDSGGFQLFSLAKLAKITEEGVHFQSHLDGSKHLLTPEGVVQMQQAIGSDIAMPLDHFPGNPASLEVATKSVEQTIRWLKRTQIARQDADLDMFAIIQGATFEALRRTCIEQALPLGFDGYSIGGLSVGEDKAAMWPVIELCHELLPKDKPRYLMGVGKPEDLVEGVYRGVDMFDCVIPTRNARNGALFTSRGPIAIKNARYLRDESPIDPECACFVCQNHSRAYIRYLFKNDELLGLVLNTHHNVFYYLRLMEQMRQAIVSGSFSKWRQEFYEKRSNSDDSVD